MGDPSDGNDTKNCEVAEKRNDLESVKKVLVKEERDESVEGKGEKEFLSQDKEPSQDTLKTDDSSVLGVTKDQETEKPKTEKCEDDGEKKGPSSETIAKAMKKRAKYVKENSDQLTLAGLRRLLEEDLGLEKNSLDPYKRFIRDQVDEVLNTKKVSQSSPSVKKIATKTFKGKVAKKVKREESSDSADSESDDGEDDVKPKRKNDTKEGSSELKKRKKPTKEVKLSGKRIKTAEKSKEDNRGKENGNSSEDSHSRSSAETPTTKKAASTPAYGKRVEHLKSVIKSCGMSVPPVLYKKVNQVPENKRESRLMKELEEILSKEGLSANPSEKEIREVRKKKERAKELEGIDMSNIVSSTRRRSTTSYVAPPKPKTPVESDGESSEDEEDDDDDDDNDDSGNDGSQSEESNVDDDRNSD